MLVGVALPGHTDEQVDASLDELALLIDTAGADEAGRITQRRDAPDHTWFIGKGKVDELKELCLAVDADTVVFDNELAPAQQYNLEKKLGRTAIDRTAVILDIFAQNAHTLEGKAQVELALLRYRLPRLRRGVSGNLTQQGGGIGTRGPGETKLEVDRRRIMRRITKLEHDLVGPAAHARPAAQGPRPQRARRGHDRRLHQRRQVDAAQPAHARPACSSRTACSPRSIRPPAGSPLPGGEPVLLTDTVGFVRRLPHGLVQAFKSTLEVARDADFLVHVVDASSPDPEGEIAGGAHGARRDRRAATCPRCSCSTRPTATPTRPSSSSPTTRARSRSARSPATASTSSCRRSAIGCASLATVVELLVPYERGDVLASVHREGEVVSTVARGRRHPRPRPARRRVGGPARRIRRSLTA